jgi:hypothetical protein
VTEGSGRADLVAAWAIGIGVGLIALQLTWLAGNRVASVFWDAPVGPTVAFTTAVVVGIVVSIIAGRRLAKKTTQTTSA